MTIQVTQKFIADGAPSEGCGCAVALAVKAATGQFVFVSATHITVGLDRRYSMNRELRAFVDAFDAGEPVEPFEFELPC